MLAGWGTPTLSDTGCVYVEITYSIPNLILQAVTLPAAHMFERCWTRLAAANAVPLHLADAQAIHNGIFLLPAFVALGTLAVLMVRKLQPRNRTTLGVGQVAAEPARTQAEEALARTADSGNGQVTAEAPNGGESAQEAVKPAPESGTHLVLPRLSGLRGELFLPGIRELDRAKHGEQERAGVETLMNAIAPFEAMFGKPKPARNSSAAEAKQAKPEDGDPLCALHPDAESKTVANKAGAKDDRSPNAAAKPKTPAKRRTGKNGEVFGDVQILPSKTGQYKRK
jgi:hypothetical protein